MGPVIAFLLLLQAAPAEQASGKTPSKTEVLQAVRAYVSAADDAARAALPRPWQAVSPLSKAKAEDWKKDLWKVYKEERGKQLPGCLERRRAAPILRARCGPAGSGPEGGR